MKKLKVFEFDSGEREWIAASSVAGAKKVYKELTGINDFNDFEITEVPKSKWKSFVIDYPDDHPAWSETLERRMNRVNEPEYLCSTVN